MTPQTEKVASGARNSEVSLQFHLPVKFIGTITSFLNMNLKFQVHMFNIFQVFRLVLILALLIFITQTALIEVDLSANMEEVRTIRIGGEDLLLMKLVASGFIMFLVF